MHCRVPPQNPDGSPVRPIEGGHTGDPWNETIPHRG
jgi:hypothetical protein